jgi:hypothetical protein
LNRVALGLIFTNPLKNKNSKLPKMAAFEMQIKRLSGIINGIGQNIFNTASEIKEKTV